jgi:hypothetical protein
MLLYANSKRVWSWSMRIQNMVGTALFYHVGPTITQTTVMM